MFDDYHSNSAAHPKLILFDTRTTRALHVHADGGWIDRRNCFPTDS